MKLIFVILFLSLVGTEAYTQKKPLEPIIPYGSHTLAQIKTFALGSTRRSLSWKAAAMQLEKNKLTIAKDATGVRELSIDSILSNLRFEEIKLDSMTFSNSGWSYEDSAITFYTSKTVFEGTAGICYYRGLRVVLFKLNCLNLLMVKERKPSSSPVVPKDDALVDKSSGKDSSKNCCCTTINNYYGTAPASANPKTSPDMKDVTFSTGNNNGITTETGWKQQDMYLLQIPQQYCDGSQPWFQPRTQVVFRLDVNFGRREYMYCPNGGNRFIPIPQNNWGFFNLQISNNNWRCQSFGNQQYGGAYYQNRQDVGDRNFTLYRYWRGG